MEPKPAFFALDELINKEWKTRLTAKADKEGAVQFRGFKGTYELTWEGDDGKRVSQVVQL
jgi:hypothetical protein